MVIGNPSLLIAVLVPIQTGMKMVDICLFTAACAVFLTLLVYAHYIADNQMPLYMWLRYSFFQDTFKMKNYYELSVRDVQSLCCHNIGRRYHKALSFY